MFPMKLEVTITDAKQLHTLAALLGGTPAELPTAKVEKKAEKKVEAQKTEPEAQTSPDADPTAPAATEGAKTFDDAKKLTIALVQAKGRDAAVAVLDKYGVKQAAKLSADQIEAFCADAEEALK